MFGLLAADKSQNLSESGEEGEQRDSNIQMDVKFEEEPYEDEDWFLMLLSELIFDKLKLEKPEIELNYVPLIVEEEGEILAANHTDMNESTTNEEPNLK